jgi:hypothetical protein
VGFGISALKENAPTMQGDVHGSIGFSTHVLCHQDHVLSLGVVTPNCT